MRNMSFALTAEQVRRREKTVTRRLGWGQLKPGTLLQPVVKGQGLKKGEKVERIGGPIRVLRVNIELLCDLVERYDQPYEETAAEGFPDMSGREFIEMFCEHNGCDDMTGVTRIEFEYVQP